MYRIIYSVVFYLAIPIILLRLLLRSIKVPAYRQRLAERFAFSSPAQEFIRQKQAIWVHAVSVGETVASAPLVTALQQRYPGMQIIITTMTPTGSDRVRDLFGDKVFHRYIPYDLPGACQRFLENYQPSLLILMETELWPNLVYACHRNGVKVLLANARLSEKSAAGYGRLGTFTRSLLEKIDKIAAQASPDAQRFIDLGVKPAQIEVTGSLKFMVETGARAEQAYFTSIRRNNRPTLVAASTRDGEEEKVLTAFEECLKTIPSLLLILVPRHPERFAKVFRLSEGRQLVTVWRSDNGNVSQQTQVVIGDSMGEMLDYYSVANIAFVGGSLVNTGCQNVLEPAALGIPVLVGPSQFNFATICKQLEHSGALTTVQNEGELAKKLSDLLTDEKAQQEMGRRGKQLIRENQNALPALLDLIEPLIRTGA